MYQKKSVERRMTNLCHLELEGDIVSGLALLRFFPDSKPVRSSRPRDHLRMFNAPGVNVHGFVSALRKTEWTYIAAQGLSQPAALGKEHRIEPDRQADRPEENYLPKYDVTHQMLNLYVGLVFSGPKSIREASINLTGCEKKPCTGC